MNATTKNDDVLHRLTRLERENRGFRLLGSLMLAGLAALGLIAQAPARTAKTVEAERFILVDQAGKTRAGFAVARDGNIGLRLTDTAGTTRLAFEVQANGEPWVTLSDSQGHRRVAMVVNPDGSPGFSLLDVAEKARLGMSASDKGAAILFGDGTGKVRASVGVAPSGSASVGLADADGEMRAILIVMPDATGHLRFYSKDGKVAWKAP
jgi:hypothetical protein